MSFFFNYVTTTLYLQNVNRNYPPTISLVEAKTVSPTWSGSPKFAEKNYLAIYMYFAKLSKNSFFFICLQQILHIKNKPLQLYNIHEPDIRKTPHNT